MRNKKNGFVLISFCSALPFLILLIAVLFESIQLQIQKEDLISNCYLLSLEAAQQLQNKSDSLNVDIINSLPEKKTIYAKVSNVNLSVLKNEHSLKLSGKWVGLKALKNIYEDWIIECGVIVKIEQNQNVYLLKMVKF